MATASIAAASFESFKVPVSKTTTIGLVLVETVDIPSSDTVGLNLLGIFVRLTT